MTDQLDLFASLPAEPSTVAETIPFPCAHRIGRARHAAEKIIGKQTDKGREAYWRDLISKMAAQMRRAGVSDSRIERELDNFKVLVQRILDSQPADQARQ